MVGFGLRPAKLFRREIVANCSIVRTLRREFSLIPAIAVAMLLPGVAFAPRAAMAADVACAPDPSGTAIANATETCAGAGDKINYNLPAVVSSTVTLNNAVITGTAVRTTD